MWCHVYVEKLYSMRLLNSAVKNNFHNFRPLSVIYLVSIQQRKQKNIITWICVKIGNGIVIFVKLFNIIC